MRIKYFLLIAIASYFIGLNASVKRVRFSSIHYEFTTDKSRVEKLKLSFQKNEYITFFELFPNDFSELVNFYGFDDKIGKKMPLYDFYDSHIKFLFNYEGKINPETFVNKIFDISNNGVWEADAVSLFQTKMYELILKKPNLFLNILAKKEVQVAKQFWHFVLDGSTKYDKQIKKQFEQLFQVINKIDGGQAKILKEEFETMYN